MAKTQQTIDLEKALYVNTAKQGVFGCFEVTIGWFGSERVDYITIDTKDIVRCYEIKVTKADFHSKAKNTFLGEFNYYVMSDELYEQVKCEIPEHIGVHNGYKVIKKPKKQIADIDKSNLKSYIIRSLSRYFNEVLANENESYVKQLKRDNARLKNERDRYYREQLRYHNFLRLRFGRNWEDEIENEFKKKVI